jgi:hypothetical protein
LTFCQEHLDLPKDYIVGVGNPMVSLSISFSIQLIRRSTRIESCSAHGTRSCVKN